jgi:hypothetical protein
MIALPSSLPLIKIGSENLASCDAEWLRRSLRDAAARAEVPEWFADDVVSGVITFLRNHYQGTTITLDSLYDRIHDTLESLGLDELAKELTPTAPPLRISLPDLAHKAGEGYELAFFRLLEQRFAAATDEGIEQVYFYGLRTCVQRLTSLGKWTRRCESLREEITHFLEHEAQKASAQRPNLSLAIC